MARTVRRVNPKVARCAAHWLDGRKAALVLKGARALRSEKCQRAYVDNEGNHRLNTWSESLSKAGSYANRQIRRAGKLQARLALAEL